jgi:hypothetical protein
MVCADEASDSKLLPASSPLRGGNRKYFESLACHPESGIVTAMSTAEFAAVLRTVRPARIRNAAIAGVAVLFAIGLLLVARRIAGALTVDLAIAPLTATLLVAAVFVLGGRTAWRHLDVIAAKDVELAFAWAGTAAILLLSIGCAWPSTDNFAWVLALPLVVGDHFSRVAFLTTRDASRRVHPRGPRDAPVSDSHSNVVEASAIPPLAPPFEGGGLDGNPLQQLTRVRTAEGIESIHGTLQAEFAAGQRHATLHVGFCPPLEGQPAVEVEVIDGPDATVKVVQAFAHGARFELRLAEPAEDACRVAIEFAASHT